MRTLIRALLALLLVAIVVFLFVGFWTGRTVERAVAGSGSRPTATSGTIDTERARERGAELGERAAVAAEKVKETVEEAALTGKIKAKLALDDTVKARTIDVSTSGSTVTMSGTVRSAAERDRAIALARETAGVTRVVDHLQIRP